MCNSVYAIRPEKRQQNRHRFKYIRFPSFRRSAREEGWERAEYKHVTEGESLHLCSFLAAVTLYRCVPHRGDEHIVLRIFPFTCAPVHARASSASEQRPMKPLSKECDGCVPIWDVQQRVCLSCGEATARSPLTQVRSLSKHPKVSEGGRMGADEVQARR